MANGFAPIGGSLPFSGGGGSNYANAYGASLAMNQANYNNVLSGYQQLGQQQQQGQQAVSQGYDRLQAGVLSSIQGIDQSQRQAIQDQYARNVGQQSQQLISRGLGNSTVQSSVERGLLFDKTKSDIALTNATQGLNAQYMSSIGQAALGYQGQAVQNNVGLGAQQLQFMNSVQAGYPDARAYAELARMKGAAGGGGGSGSSPGVGAVPGGGPSLRLNSSLGNSPGNYYGGSGGGYQSPAASYNYGNSPGTLTNPGQNAYNLYTNNAYMQGGQGGSPGSGFDQTDEWSQMNGGDPGYDPAWSVPSANSDDTRWLTGDY